MDLRPLRHRDYRLLFTAKAVTFLGTMVTYVALPYQMYALTGSSLKVGLLGLAELVPMLGTAFLGGALADAVDRRKLVLAAELLLGLGSTALLLMAWHGSPPVWSLYVAAAYMSALASVQRPALESLAPRLVEHDDLPAVASLGALRGSLGMILGPALGGALIGAFGVAAAYAADVVSYGLSLVAVLLIRHRGTPARDADAAPALSVHAIAESLRYARSRQELIGTYVVDFVAMIFGMPLALFPALATTLGGAAVLGPLYAAPAVGALVASLTSQWTPRVPRHGLAVLLAATVWGLAIVAFGFCDDLFAALFFLAVAGGADAVSGMFRSTLWNQTIPDALRGRMAAIEMISYMSGPLLGHVEAGFAAELVGVKGSVISGGVLCVVGVIVAGMLLPRFVAYDARTFKAAPFS